MAAKILLVEDDKSLLEIYNVRLQAEGYQIVVASDGEQALAVAIKERPDLIITDVMMPKISGFDMLDILRSTTETKDVKVIMMTALSSDDQRDRGERMGANKYLVKSQVGIEDVVRTVHEVLGDSTASAPSAAPATPAAPVAQPAAAMPIPAPTPAAEPTPSPMPAMPTPAPVTQGAVMPATQPSSAGPSASQPSEPSATPVPLQTSTVPTTPSAKQRIIQPLSAPEDKVDINELLDKELAKEAGLDMLSRPQVESTSQEKAMVESQIQATEQQPTPPAAAPTLNPNPAPTSPPTDRPAPSVPSRDTPLQAPPRIPTI